MVKIKENQKGYSLVELMLVIALIGIMVVIGFVSLVSARNKNAVEVAAREVAAVAREAQNYALSGKDLWTSTQNNCGGYTFGWNAATYSISGCTNKIYTLKNGVTFGGPNFVTFDIPFSHVSNASITLQKGAYSYYVCIHESGIVSEQEAACVFL